MPVEEPSVRPAIVARVHFLLRVGVKRVELNGSQTHSASARRVSHVHIIDRILDGGSDDILTEFTGRHRFRWIRPDAVGAKPIGKLARRIGWAEKHRARANVLIGKKQSAPGELDVKRGGDLDMVLVFLGVEQNRKPDLFEITQTVSLFRLGLRLAQRGQQHAR